MRIHELQKQYRDLDNSVKEIVAKAAGEGRSIQADLDTGSVAGAQIDAQEMAVLHKCMGAAAVLRPEIKRELLAAEGSAIAGELEPVLGGGYGGGFEHIGEYFQAIARAAFPRGARLGGKPCGVIDNRLLGVHAVAGMSEAVPSEGGFMVEIEYSRTLLQKAYDASVLANLCNRISVGPNANGIAIPYLDESSRATGSRMGGVQVFRANEAAAATAKKPKFGRFELRLEKTIGLCYAPNELLEDATALGQVLTESFAREFAFKLDDEIVRGDGAGKCLGFLNSPSLVTVAAQGGQSADTINSANVLKMYSAMWGPSRTRAVWLANSEAIPQLLALALATGTSGQLVYMPAGGISGRTFDTLFGRPVFYPEQMSAIGDVGDIAFCDFGEYVLIDKGGMQAAQSIHVNFTTDEMAFRFVTRNNGAPSWATSLTPYKGAQATSPFITLAAR
jgi:HK97 family phage major capsid protein